jgi:hypothetical protein
MASCRICLEDMKKPAALPCGHIFCSDCIVKTIQAVKPYTHLQPCPICRTLYNIAPINLNVVPANLRPFLTPSIRRVYIDPPSTSQENDTADVNEQPATVGPSPVAMTSPTSELARLRAENITLRNHCALWRKRAEMHGAANLGLLNFARVVRDQASHLARERDELQTRCHSLKRKVDDFETSVEPRRKTLSSIDSDLFTQHSGSPVPGSLLFAPPFQHFPEQGTSGQSLTSEATVSSPTEPPFRDSRPRKRAKTDQDPYGPASGKRVTPVFIPENIALGKR